MSKTETQSRAESLAKMLEFGAFSPNLLQNEIGVRKGAAAELRRLDAENKALRGLAATCYAGLGAECNLPENWLDALNAAANGEPFDTEGLLPFTAAEARDETIRQLEAQIKGLRIKAARYDYIKQFGTSGETEALTHPRQVVYASIGFHGHELGAAIDARIAEKAAAKNGGAA